MKKIRLEVQQAVDDVVRYAMSLTKAEQRVKHAEQVLADAREKLNTELLKGSTDGS